MKMKDQKIKISDIDLKTFLLDSLVIDPYWEDLYNPEIKPKNCNDGIDNETEK